MVKRRAETPVDAQRKRPRLEPPNSDAPPRPAVPASVSRAKRLGIQPSHPRNQRVRGHVNLRGAKISRGLGSGTFASAIEEEVIWVTRKTSFAAFLRRGVSAFVDRGATRLRIMAMGAALPLALALGPAIRDAIPSGASALEVRVTTGSEAVTDEIEPIDEDADLEYRQRLKSTVSVVLQKL